ncbi:diaminopimelate decarboxylase [Virgibacillus soli]|uniref:Diaminopimelate decarboxylase n=1 Tax=Paracerasibacillus soli TaxID=480284 RepID=A0ABU5CSE8_9BACI|nr:diaminopimelate decarboxylase [Virgibacillus soli]MDY0408355.1 diaminopimelate decarboxylase [Virgibacillus soli]
MELEHYPFQINEQGNLTVSEVDTVSLVKQYGTPLYVYDVAHIRKNCRAFVDTFKKHGITAQVAYASKAFSSIAILQVVHQEGLAVDVVSKGELYTALQAGVPPEKIHFHGNNKSRSELEMALKHRVGCIVIDNFYEISLLGELLEVYNQEVDVLMRVTPGLRSNTHEYIMTGNEDSKFGFNIHNGQAEQAFLEIRNHKQLRLKGLHCHIGSQIFETEGFIKATSMLFSVIADWQKRYQFTPEVMNLGGGFGIRYTDEDQPLPRHEYVEALIEAVKHHVEQIKIPMPEIWIEPGRSIVGDAGITLYKIGSMKDIPGIRKYITVDGGMTDNLRPALYQAKYDAIVANRANDARTELVSIAGKCCESGDMLIYDINLQKTDQNDILAVLSTGAYGYSMANNYNRFTRPAVVFVENGQHQLVVKRETYIDVVQHDLSYLK